LYMFLIIYAMLFLIFYAMLFLILYVVLCYFKNNKILIYIIFSMLNNREYF